MWFGTASMLGMFCCVMLLRRHVALSFGVQIEVPSLSLCGQRVLVRGSICLHSMWNPWVFLFLCVLLTGKRAFFLPYLVMWSPANRQQTFDAVQASQFGLFPLALFSCMPTLADSGAIFGRAWEDHLKSAF